MADSLSFEGALPVAAIAAYCESFQLSLLAMTFPLASRNESVGFASGVVTPALANEGPRSAPAGCNVALLVTARLTTERANNDMWPVAAVRVIVLPVAPQRQ